MFDALGRLPLGAAIAAAAAFCTPSGSALADPPHYTLVEVTPQPLRVWTALDLGQQGQVVGLTYDLNVNPPLSKGWVWQNGAMTLLDGPDGETMTEARCIDSNGVIYGGYADRRFDLSLRMMNPVKWVGNVPVPYANNADINSSDIFACSPTTGVAVGWARPFVPGAPGWRGEYGYASELDFNTRDPERAFKWVGDTGSVLARLVGCHDDYAQAINDAGQVAVNLSSFELGGAALYDPRCGLVRLPGLGVGVDTTRANGMNATGQIVGYAQSGGGVEHPVRWDNGAVTDLGLLPGYVEGQALGINDAGVIVGGLSDQNFPFGLRDVAGFVMVNGVMYDVNALIPPGTGFTVNEAERINNAGQILVAMNPPPALGVTRYAVLTPVP